MCQMAIWHLHISHAIWHMCDAKWPNEGPFNVEYTQNLHFHIEIQDLGPQMWPDVTSKYLILPNIAKQHKTWF
jgi:hypothetical protein